LSTMSSRRVTVSQIAAYDFVLKMIAVILNKTGVATLVASKYPWERLTGKQ